MDINVVKIFILEKLKKCMVKRLVICILILKIEFFNMKVRSLIWMMVGFVMGFLVCRNWL